MDTRKQAATILRDAESRLAALIEKALRAGQYDDVAWIAGIACAIASADPEQTAPRSVVASLGLVGPQDLGAATAVAAETEAAVATSPDAERVPVAVPHDLTKQKRLNYPRFERSGERLIKLGWSAKDKAVYEHRVSLEVVREVSKRMSEKAKSKKPFKMEKLMPFHLPNGSEVPGYQAYLVLKWLQDLGEIERRGNDGYLFRNQTFNEAMVDDLLEKTPVRE